MKFVTHHASRITSLLVAGLLAVSCSPDGKPRRSGEPAPVPVVTARAVNRDVPVEIQSIGTAQAHSEVSVRPQITGRIVQVHFQEGEQMKLDALLFSIDARPWEAALNQARANLKRDEAQLLSARLQFQRTSNLFESRIASQQDLETSVANYHALEATVAADVAAMTNAELNLSYTAIRAPIEGRTGTVLVKEGNVVKAPDDVLVTLTQLRPIYLAFAVPEQYLPAIRRRSAESQEGLQVRAFAPGETNNLALGRLTFIDSSVDTNTGTILLKATFDNADGVLWPGQFVQTILTLSNLVDATVIPSQAVQNSQNGELVFVVKPDATVETRPVQTGITYDGLTVIHSGVKPGEAVVIDGQLRLTPGAKVSVKNPEEVKPPADATALNR